MKNLYTLTTILFLFIASAVQAQVKTGFSAGLIHAKWSGAALDNLNNLTGFTKGMVSTQSRTGIYAGGFVQMPLSERLSLQPGVYYSQKGYEMKANLGFKALSFLGLGAKAQVQSHYIDVPVLLNVNLTKGLHVFAGPQVSYLVKSKFKADAGLLGFSLFKTESDITDRFNRVDWAVTTGAGYTFDNGFSVMAGYDYGLSRLDRNSSTKSYNRAFKVGLAFSF